MKRTGARSVLVIAGSAAEYGAAIIDGEPVRETAVCAPLSAYGLSKQVQTREVLAYSDATGNPVLVARIFNPIWRHVPERLEQLKDPHTVIPDEAVDTKRTITLGGTTLELEYLGLNHSDSTLVMRLPREKIIFLVDTVPVGSFPGRGFIDIYPLETEEFIKKLIAMDWDRMIPGHPGVGGRRGTKQDAQTILALMRATAARRPAVARELEKQDRNVFDVAHIATDIDVADAQDPALTLHGSNLASEITDREVRRNVAPDGIEDPCYWRASQ